MRIQRGVRAAAALALLLGVGLGGCATHHAPLPIEQVMERGHAGQSPERIIDAVRSSRTTYALRGSDFGKLKSVGVPDPVLDYLQQSYVNDLDMFVKYWVWGQSVGACTWCVPQQVDLTNMADPRTFPGITMDRPQQPQGMPDWYVPYTPKSRKITIEEIHRMVEAKVPEAEVLATVRNSTLLGVTGEQHLNSITSHPIAVLTGAQLARLRVEGVPDAVLDAIQLDFIGQFVELQRLRYQNWGTHAGGWS